MAKYRLGIDAGGTFTDFVLSAGDGTMAFYKEPSTPDDPSRALIEGLGKLLDQTGLTPADVDALMHARKVPYNQTRFLMDQGRLSPPTSLLDFRSSMATTRSKS